MSTRASQLKGSSAKGQRWRRTGRGHCQNQRYRGHSCRKCPPERNSAPAAAESQPRIGLPPARWFNIACLHKRTIETWSSVFGEPAIQLQVYAPHTNAIECLRRICQIPKGIGTQQQITRNQRLGHQTVLRFAQLNRELNNFNQHGMINPDWIARRDAILSARSNDPPYAPSPEEVDVRSLWD